MAIFTILSKWGKDPPDSFLIKTNKILCDLSLHYIKQIDSMLPCVRSVYRSQKTSKRGKNISDTLAQRFVCHFFVLTTLWRHLWSITIRTHGNMESISYNFFLIFYFIIFTRWTLTLLTILILYLHTFAFTLHCSYSHYLYKQTGRTLPLLTILTFTLHYSYLLTS